MDSTRRYHEKEAFVSGHSGTTPLEILLICLVVPVGVRLYHRLRRRSPRRRAADVPLEYVAVVLPALLVQTSMVGPAVLVAAMYSLPTMVGANEDTSSCQVLMDPRRPAFLTVHRSSVYILTTIAILAVDFPIFPRRYCKTEESGYGLMDIGASSFVIIAGWTSALNARGADGAPQAVGSLAFKATKKCLPLFIIGLVRLATNKGLEYQEHVSEYGVHWNFFFTLSFVEGFMVLWKGFKKHAPTRGLPIDLVVGTLIMASYQRFLTFGGGQDFVENGARSCSGDTYEGHMPRWMCDAFAANREGILGCVGYLSLRMISEDMSRYCLINGTKKGTTGRGLLLASVVTWTLHFVLTRGLGIPSSRRSTNASFVSWSLAHNVTLLLLFYKEMRGNDLPPIQDAVNQFGLAVFLASNILTGLVNLTVDTLHSSNFQAFCVLSLYLALVCGIALGLDVFGRGDRSSDRRIKIAD
ncbi:hypothetical protein THAOC_09172 [Thalassiosira oceanica]|uniref:GPI-anchored wall transfer protein n=1 Tax=Thalassiosira oceanica TaxID=159749 RepID=K0T880_THAOC|nr:hypothetical protein THAOC_09172 [Thalassiosira oceanica]|eukprot:EJK69556.1 hypothetical protein THAOC_09172 [Thalassiosira oceanica]